MLRVPVKALIVDLAGPAHASYRKKKFHKKIFSSPKKIAFPQNY
jgi:hypothetical protein